MNINLDNSMGDEDPSENSMFYSANKSQEQFNQEASQYLSEQLMKGLNVSTLNR